ncbi:MAG: helix-turn-helix transcriptional regulator [Desulfitobacteriaceae bacterium]
MEDIALKNNLKEVRNHLDITQNEVAHRIGVQKAYYSRLERGEFVPNIKTCLLIKRALIEIYDERTGKYLEKLTLERLFYLDVELN